MDGPAIGVEYHRISPGLEQRTDAQVDRLVRPLVDVVEYTLCTGAVPDLATFLTSPRAVIAPSPFMLMVINKVIRSTVEDQNEMIGNKGSKALKPRGKCRHPVLILRLTPALALTAN